MQILKNWLHHALFHSIIMIKQGSSISMVILTQLTLMVRDRGCRLNLIILTLTSSLCAETLFCAGNISLVQRFILSGPKLEKKTPPLVISDFGNRLGISGICRQTTFLW